MDNTLGLDRYRWHQRLLLVFAASSEDDSYRAMQPQLAAQAAALAERDMIVGTLFDHATGNFNGKPVASNVTAAERQRWGLALEAFALLLIGKDGTLKQRYTSPLALGEVFAEVDAMPMRQGEMREQGE